MDKHQKQISTSLSFFLGLAKAKAVISRRFDNRLGFYGLGFSDFMILFHLIQSPEGKLRRTDLAEKVGLTASGVTRMLLPMEKIGLIKRESTEHDARVSYVVLAPAGIRLYSEALETLEALSEDILPSSKAKGLASMSETLDSLGKTAVH